MENKKKTGKQTNPSYLFKQSTNSLKDYRKELENRDLQLKKTIQVKGK